MARVSKNRFAGLLIPFFLAACLILSYWFYWNKVAAQVENRARAAIPQSVAAQIKVTGFPYRLTLNLEDFNLADEHGLGFKASRVVATATPFNPLLWVLESAHEPAMSLPGGPMRPLRATNLKASLRLNPNGLERLSLTFDGVEAEGAQSWSLGTGAMHFVTDPKNAETIAMRVDLAAIKLGKPLEGPSAILGQTISRVMLAGPINQGRAFARSPLAWSQAEGKVDIMAGELLWGPVAFTDAKGELSLSPSQKWQGSVTGNGALKPEGIAVAALSGPINLTIIDNKMSLNGLPGINIADAFGDGE
jgi:Uncharacterized protein conserved in bacteria (DUF2125)